MLLPYFTAQVCVDPKGPFTPVKHELDPTLQTGAFKAKPGVAKRSDRGNTRKK